LTNFQSDILKNCFTREISLGEFKKCKLLDEKSINLWSINQWKDELLKSHVKAYAIFFKKEILGVCVYEMLFNEVEISYLSISPEFKKKGLGKKLFNKLLNKFEELDVLKIILEVSNKNKTAIKFYENFGFKTIGIRKKYYKDGSDALIKEKILLKK
tara:strand:+ start:507 stop:977 length:471 start_codon:yes stop_codon:yes gene_type:complete